MHDKAAELIAIISEKDLFQAKALARLAENLSQDEKEGLSALISFYEKTGDSVAYLAECYLWLIQSFNEEQYYFVENGRYRYSSSEETNAFFYQNPTLMERYMKGLAISQYLLEQHRQCRKWFCDRLSCLNAGGNWLEVGIGHGEYFTLALQYTNYKHYLGIDISPTSVRLTQEMVQHRVHANSKSVEIREQDFFAHKKGGGYDACVMGEILEHVENPMAFLAKVHEITHEKSFIYVTTVINAPAIDHIYLFRNVEEIEELYQEAGFEICEKGLFPSHGYTVEKALKRKAAIITAHVLKKTVADQ